MFDACFAAKAAETMLWLDLKPVAGMRFCDAWGGRGAGVYVSQSETRLWVRLLLLRQFAHCQLLYQSNSTPVAGGVKSTPGSNRQCGRVR